jgi:hypothetical protein
LSTDAEQVPDEVTAGALAGGGAVVDGGSGAVVSSGGAVVVAGTVDSVVDGADVLGLAAVLDAE